MELKSGYKQSEVGIIPEEWEVYRLEEITNPSRPISYGIVQTGPNILNGVPCLRVVDIQDGRINRSGLIRTSEKISKGYGRTVLKSGDLVMPLRGKVGDIAEVGADLDGANLTRGVALVSIRTGVNSRYLKFYVSWGGTRGRLEQSMNGSALQEIPIAALRSFQVVVPYSNIEQQAIAEALIDADALIDSLEQLLAKKRQIKQGAMQELLTGQRRLPGFTAEWKTKSLGSICHIKTGARNNQDKLEDGDYPFFVRSATVERINSYSHECEAILVPGEGDVGRIFHYIEGRFDVHQRVYAITKFSPDVSGKYVYLYMSVKFGDHAMQNSVKATVDSLRLPTFLAFEVRLPPTLLEQVAIATVLSTMGDEITTLETQLQKARDLKQGMMQELLTGRIRLI